MLKRPTESSELARLLRDRRGELRLSQAEYQRKLGFAKADYVGKVERDSIVGPIDRQFLHLVAQDFAKSANPKLRSQTLEALAAGHRGHSPWRLGMGHTLWGAPIAFAAYRGWLADETTIQAIGQPVSVTSVKMDGIPFFSASPITRPDPPSGPGDVERAAAQSASAAEVLRWLEDDRIDIACLPASLVQSRPGIIVVGAVADSASGCVLVLPEQDPLFRALKERCGAVVDPLIAGTHDEVFSASTYDFGFALRGLRDPKISVHNETIAVDVLHRALGVARRVPHVGSAPATNWHVNSVGVRIDTLGSPPVITWEPLASWLWAHDSRLRRVPLYYAHDADVGQEHVAMSLAIKSGAGREAKFEAAKWILQKAWWAANEIRAEAPRGSRDMENLSDFYGIPRHELRRAVHTVRFCVYLLNHPEA